MAAGILESDSHESCSEYDIVSPPLSTNRVIRQRMKKSIKFINICMVTYNRLEFTKQAIASIEKFTDYPYKLNIIDNKSEDGTGKYLQSALKKGLIHRLLLLDQNIGIARASNLGWHMEPDALAFIKFDNDIVIQKPGWLSAMIKVFEAIPRIGILGYNFEPRSYPEVNSNGVVVRIKPVGAIGGACTMIPKRTEKKIGYWCEDYGLYGEEDADYTCRVRLSGMLPAYMQDERVGFHLPAGRAASINVQAQAKDGMEETLHRQYRLWKDAQRRKNAQPDSVFHRNISEYKSGRRSCRIGLPYLR